MTIGFFTDYYYPSIGGTEVAVDNFAKALRDQGHKVIIFTSRFKHAQTNEPDVVRLPSYQVPGTTAPAVIGSKRVAREIARTYKLDAIHCHTQFGAFWVAHDVARLLNVPLVITIHTNYEQQVSVVWSGMLLAGLSLWAQTWCKAVARGLRRGLSRQYSIDGPLGRRLLWRWQLYQIEAADRVIVPAWHRQVELQKIGVQKVEVVPNLIAKSKAEPLPKDAQAALDSLSGAGPLILSAAQHRVEKRIDVLIEALAKLPAHLPWRLALAGSGPEHTKITQLIAEHTLENRVAILGSLPNAAMQSLLQRTDLTVLLSYDFDTQPMMILEALTCGVPVFYCDPKLATDCYLTDQNSVCAPGPGLEEIAVSLESLLADADRLRRLKQGAARPHAELSAQGIVGRLLALYS